MQKANIVIGLGFGDEGKGITTDFLCSQNPNAMVVRFSGGQQAAHTVMLDGKKHVHSSFASGALRGLPSYYSEHCTVHPTLLFTEREELLAKGGNTDFYVHPLSKITTPFDVWHNRKNAKNLAHGTCGKGVGATMKRNEGPYKLYAIDLLAPEEILVQKLRAICSYYGLSNQKELLEEVAAFLSHIEALDWNIEGYDFLKKYETLIFEGSQGVLLDMDHGIFPNVTYANTSSKNAMEICRQLQIDNIEMYYATRCYLTRHGSGWMPDEQPLKLKNNEEETCTYNEFQKQLRTAPLDYEVLNYALRTDAIYAASAKKNLVVTCLDQLEFTFRPEKLKTRFDRVFGSYSPASENFKEITSIKSKINESSTLDRRLQS
ncbi:MAG: adenylosuccinate synthetase [Pricia sp.]